MKVAVKKNIIPLPLSSSFSHTLSDACFSVDATSYDFKLHSHLLWISKKKTKFLFFQPGNRRKHCKKNCFTFLKLDVRYSRKTSL
jgi:hypothetical protein